MTKNNILHSINEYGNEFPWADLKTKSRYVAKLMQEIVADGDKTYTRTQSERFNNCSSILTFAKEKNDSPMKLYKAYYCGNKFCYTCNAIKSRKVYQQILHIVDNMLWDNPNKIEFMHVSFTLKNIDGNDIKNTLKKMQYAWNLIMEQIKKQYSSYQLKPMNKLARLYLGAFRSMEITYNSKSKTYHPHIHALFAMKKSNMVMTSNDWQILWKHYMKLNYVPVMDSFAISNFNNFDICQSVANIAKYIAKGINIDFRKLPKEEAKQVLIVLGKELKRAKSILYSGIFDKYRKTMLDDEEDLIAIGFANQKESSKESIERYYKKQKLFNNDFLFGNILFRKLKRKHCLNFHQSFKPNIITRFIYYSNMK